MLKRLEQEEQGETSTKSREGVNNMTNNVILENDLVEDIVDISLHIPAEWSFLKLNNSNFQEGDSSIKEVAPGSET